MRKNSCKSITTNPPQKRSSFRKVQFQTCREHLNDKDSVGQLVVDTSRNKMHPPGYNSYLASRQPSGINHIHLLCLYLPQDMYFFFKFNLSTKNYKRESKNLHIKNEIKYKE